MEYLFYVLEAALGYLLGSISFSVILTKQKYKVDVRNEGSGNAGATNVARVFGMKAGLFTLLFDILKMVIPMAVGLALSGDWGVTVAGACGIIGHCFPLYFGFKGGKGVSVAATIAMFIDWRVTVISLLVFIIFVAITRIVSISSCLAALSVLTTTIIFCYGEWAPITLALFTAVLVIFMHRSNLQRLVRGEEKKFSPKK
jgi:glycerol-3-phosphate acyltransferase PlsY